MAWSIAYLLPLQQVEPYWVP